MNIEDFKKEIKKLGIEPNEDQMEQLRKYTEFLIEYNTHTNITAITDEKNIYLKHYYDSLTLAKIIDLTKENNLLDIGSGAGFPGMVLKIFYPNLEITLVDSNNKKTKFLTELKKKLGLEKLTIINDRVEKITKEYINKFDVVTARAVTNLPVLIELAIPLVKPNKYFIAMKGNVLEELNKSKYAIEQLDCHLDKVIEFKLPIIESNRSLIKIEKLQKSELNKLRSYEKIIKKPLQK